MMANGEINGYICQGFNPLQAFPDKGKIRKALGNLKFLVTMDPLDTETSRFWENFGPLNPSDPASIQTEVFQLPTTCFAEENGALVNSARWLQWHWKAADAPGEAKTDIWIMSAIFHRMREMYRKEGGAFPDPILNLTWNYTNPVEPNPEELAKEMNGRALVDIKDSSGAVTLRAGELLDGFAQLRDDGTTESGCWIFSGSFTEKGNQMARRDATDPREQGIAPNWAWAWPANRRILYNRASADLAGKPWNPSKPIIEWDGSRWVGIDVPDYGPTTNPSEGVGPFIMNDEGLGRLFVREQMVDGPFPEHYEPFESPIANLLHPKVQSNPAARVFADDRKAFGDASEFPYVATTYRLTEHFHFWTKHALINAILQPEEFIEIGEALAKEKGIATSRLGARVVEAWVCGLQGMRDQAHPPDDSRWKSHPRNWGAAPLGLHRPGAQGLRRQHSDPVRRRCQCANTRVQGVPGQYRGDQRPRDVKEQSMTNLQSQDFIRISASTLTPPSVRNHEVEVAKLIDVTRCIGCKACQAACMEWNNLRDEIGYFEGTYDNPMDLDPSTWTLMRFTEWEDEKGNLEWLIRKDGCMHCEDPGCLKACPAPGAIVQYANGIVDFISENCIGCGYCVKGCPFNIPRISQVDRKSYKCTLCSDRVAVGLEPACVKACPTGAILFGSKADMTDWAGERIVDLKSRGFANAGLYDPPGVDGTHVMYVLHHADKPSIYAGLPDNPQISAFVSAWKGMLKPVALAGIAFAAVAGFMHWVVAGPNEVQPEDELAAKRLLETEGQRDANDVPPETDKPV